MSLELPKLPPLPSVIQPVISDEKPNKPKIVIIYSKNIDDDIPLISQYGKVLKFNEAMINVDLAKDIDCDYLLCDASNKVCLANIEKHYNDDSDVINFVHFGYFFENGFYSDINCITKFKNAKNQSDFNYSLLNEKKLKSPNKLINCVSYIISFLAGLKK